MNATFTGVHDYDHRLPDWSPAAAQRDLREMRELRQALLDEHPLPTGGASALRASALRADSIALDTALARANLEVRIAEQTSRFFRDRNPALWTGEAIFGAVSLMIRPFASVRDRLVSLTARLNAIPEFLAPMRVVLDGVIPPLWRARAERECATANGLLERGLERWLRDAMVDAEIPSSLVHSANAAAARARAAFAECGEWLAQVGAATDAARNPADSNLTGYACGESLFATLLSVGHFSMVSPRALLARAEQEIEVAQAHLDHVTAAEGGSWSDVQAALAADHPLVEQYYDTFHRRWQECRTRVTEQNAVTWPDWPIRYVPIPAWAAEFAPQLYWLFYRSPAPFDPYDTYEYIVTAIDTSLEPDEQERRLRVWNHSAITLNHVVHHGAVGHHVQNWHARHRSASRMGSIAAVGCANRIGMFLGGSMAEGWACYATVLMEELGLLTPLEWIAEQHTHVRMLARAIVDVRLHLGDFTLPECVAYYERTVGMSAQVATAETVKNSMFPCTALMYWLGAQGILDLRRDVKSRLGEQFSLRAFHDELLGWGAIPVPLIAAMMTESAG